MSDDPVHHRALRSPLGEIAADQGRRSQASGRLSKPMGNASHNLMWMLRSLVDPTITLLTLLAVALVVQGGVRNRDIILAVIAFSLSYPGSIGFDHRPCRLLRQIFGSWGALCGLMLLFGLATGMLRSFDPNILAAWVIGTPVLQAIAHQLIPSLLARVWAISEHDRAVIIGANELGRTLARALLADPLEDTRVTAFFDDRTPARLGETLELPVRRGLENVADFVREQHIDRIYIALPMASQPRILNLLDQLRDTTASIYFFPDIFLYDLIQARVDTVGGLPVVAVCETPCHGTTGVIKRLSDLCIALPAIVLTGPVMLAIALAIKLTMPGPVLFRQRRYGLDGQQIVVWKFRSMRVAEDGDVVRQATRHDERITPLGAFLRRSSLDELPQFFNVLQGRMSVVGPRPHAVAHNEMYRKLIKGYMIRHKVKPGITGWAQVNGARGETDTIEKMQRRIAYDIEYLRSWSLRLDVTIVWRTITQAIRGDRNAY